MVSSGFSSPGSDSFPAGLRVLVVDDDHTLLKILEKMLKDCNYEVTTCTSTRAALDLLHERKDAFEIVISDVNMTDMDGFEFLEHVSLTMDVPVIMMSVDGETSRVMKGVQHGACGYLLKPISMKELQNIWQHVFRKRMNEVKDIESQESETQTTSGVKRKFDDGPSLKGDTATSGKKRKDLDNKNYGKECGGTVDHSSPVKKSRLVWTVDLHQKFVKAVNHIGLDKVGPKKILEVMGDPRVTRENVASHLQKYRIYLKRLQKENEQKTGNGVTKLSDISKASARKGCFQSSVTRKPAVVQQTVVPSENYSPMSTTSQINQPYGPLDSEVNSWNVNVHPIQFGEEIRPHFHPDQRFDQLPLPIRSSTYESRINPSYVIEKANQVDSTPKPTFQQMSCSMWCTNAEQKMYDKHLVVSYSPPQGDFYGLNHHDLATFKSFGYANQRVISDFPPSLYEANFDSTEYVEYHVIDQSLFR